MTLGALLLALSYTTSAILQHLIDQTQPPQPGQSDVFVKIINNFPSSCDITVTEIGPIPLNITSYEKTSSSLANENLIQLEGPLHDSAFIRIQPVITFSQMADCMNHKTIRYKMDALAGHVNYIFVTPHGIFSRSLLYEKPSLGTGESAVSINFALPCKIIKEKLNLSNHFCKNLSGDLENILITPTQQPFALCHMTEMIEAVDNQTNTPTTEDSGCEMHDPLNIFWTSDESKTASAAFIAFPPIGDKAGKANTVIYRTKLIQPGSYKLFLADVNSIDIGRSPDSRVLLPIGPIIQINGVGGVYMITVVLNGSILSTNSTKDHVAPVTYMEVVFPPNYFSIHCQFVQYVLVIFSEILFCITGLEFAYVEAPVVLKSLILSFWFLSTAFGNLAAILLKFTFSFSRLVDQFFFNAASMFAFTALFACLACAYYDYFNFSFPTMSEKVKMNDDDAENSEYIEEISASNSKPVISDYVKRASLRATRRVTEL